ncbi:probable transcription factor At1g44810 isoform X1 [Capsella rubella]|uniref:probable transcription factor At1g44810 isoform X1 n=1 Tax=Capsella rubella TaxID=81985 RepID=UPI000CD52121|nr:probable transcription factor At1g44810 isoform X1 [Capsella rubella]
MAKTLLNPLEDPPTASLSHDDEVKTSSGEEDEEQISAAAPSSDSDSGSETGSDSESESGEEKTIAAAKSGKKRVSEATKETHVKKAKKESQKLWSEEDETSLLQGMIDFKAEKADVKANEKLKKLEFLKSYGFNVGEDEEVVILGGDTEMFDKSFVVRSIARLGVDESSVKERWRKVSVETKKRIEEKLKLVEAKEFDLLLQKSVIVNEVASAISEVI